MLRSDYGHEEARAVFGDERADYAQALKNHYADPRDPAGDFITSYATSHPHEDWAETVAHLRENGRITIIGMQGGVKGELNIGKLMAKRGAVIGTTLRPRPLGEKAQIMGAVREVVWPHVLSGAVRPVVARTFPLEQVRDAHEYFDSGSHIGKVLLTL